MEANCLFLFHFFPLYNFGVVGEKYLLLKLVEMSIYRKFMCCLVLFFVLFSNCDKSWRYLANQFLRFINYKRENELGFVKIMGKEMFVIVFIDFSLIDGDIYAEYLKFAIFQIQNVEVYE